MLTAVDHLMWGVADLQQGIDDIGRRFGVTPVAGGAHAGLGTRNALLGLTDGHYLEIIAPDPDQPLAGTFGARLADLSEPALITWAAAAADLPAVAARATAAGLDTRGPLRLRRRTPEGAALEWELLFLAGHRFGTLLPFFIDWRDSPHPSAALTAAGALEALVVETPHAAELLRMLGHLDVPLVVREADEPALRATFETPEGTVVLASTPAALGLRLAPP